MSAPSPSSASYQSPHSAFTPTTPNPYFHPSFSPFGMPPPPQSNFPMMGQGLGMPGSYPFLPSFHPGFMGTPFSQGLGGSGGSGSFGGNGNSFNNSGSGGTGFGFGGQSQDSLGSFRALLEDSSDRSTPQQQQQQENSTGGGVGSLGTSTSQSSDSGANSLGMSSSASNSAGIGPGGISSSSSSSAGGMAGGGMGGVNGLPPAPMPASSSSSMYGGYSPMAPLGYPGLSPMLGMSNPMFMPMMPSPVMPQHYSSMQPGHAGPGGPLSAMGHMAAMGSHLPGPGAGLPHSNGS